MDNISAIVEYEYTAKEPDELDLSKGAIINRIKQLPGGWWQGTLKASGKTGMFPDNFVRVLEPSSNGNHSSDDSAVVQMRDKLATSNRRCKVIYSYTQVNDDELTLAVGDVIEFLGEVEEGWWRGRLRSKVGVFPSNFVQHIEPSPILATKRPPTIGATKAVNVNTHQPESGSNSNNIHSTSTTTISSSSSTASSSIKQQQQQQQTNRKITVPVQAAAADGGGDEAVAPVAAPTLPPKPQRDYCRVEFPYAPQNEDELELKVDDIIAVINMDLPDKGWWKGELRGKVGVFPDNFVKLLAPSEVAPLNEAPPPQQTQRLAVGVGGKTNNHLTTTNASTVSTHHQSSSSSNSNASTTSKVYIKKTGGNTNSRKDSFGSRDSLNDILSETGLPTGNVAAQRKSLENKNLDLTNAVKKQQQHSNSTITTTTTSTSIGQSSSEMRKSLDSLDEKAKSPPPPVLTKKPNVPQKKTPTSSVTSVAGNLLSGLRKKSNDNKLPSSVSHDLADGVGSSKLSPGHLPDSGVMGNVVMRRAATIAVEDTDFDNVERGSMLPDMRAGRVKAPKRRPPSAAINVLGESNNNSVYVNGSGMVSSASELSEDGGTGKASAAAAAAASSDDNSTGEEQLAKPKPREWERKKAPWMEELKASQVKKKTSPSVEPRGATVAERTSKLFAAEQSATSSSTSTTTNNNNSSSSTNHTSSSSSSSTITTNNTTKVQSSIVTSSSIMQQSMYVESSNSKKEQQQSSSSIKESSGSIIVPTSDAIMSKSLSAAKPTAASSDEESRVPRPNSLSLRNRSISPLVKSSEAANAAATVIATSSGGSSSNASPAPAAKVLLNNHHEQREPTIKSRPTSSSGTTLAADAGRMQELERRVDKLEGIVQTQQRTIEDLVRALREETDRVKVLRGELDKYAQCVTQV